MRLWSIWKVSSILMGKLRVAPPKLTRTPVPQKPVKALAPPKKLLLLPKTAVTIMTMIQIITTILKSQRANL
jgi:hypothetical protein